jgi:hypothetical protein
MSVPSTWAYICIFYLTDEYVRSDDPGKPTRCENGKPSTVCLSNKHNGERGEEHQVVWFCEEVNNGVQFLPFV